MGDPPRRSPRPTCGLRNFTIQASFPYQQHATVHPMLEHETQTQYSQGPVLEQTELARSAEAAAGRVEAGRSAAEAAAACSSPAAGPLNVDC